MLIRSHNKHSKIHRNAYLANLLLYNRKDNSSGHKQAMNTVRFENQEVLHLLEFLSENFEIIL
jgi:hypothetical protein